MNPEHHSSARRSLRLVTLDSPSFSLEDRTLKIEEFKHLRAFLLGVYLAEASPVSVPADRLQREFWPDIPDGRRQGLQTTVSRLRRCFRYLVPDETLSNPVVYRKQAYSLASFLEPEVDALEFERLHMSGLAAYENRDFGDAKGLWERASGVYHYDFLEGFTGTWVRSRRALLLEKLVEIFEKLAVLSKAPDESLSYYRRGLDAKPEWEAGQLGALRCLIELGCNEDARAQFRRYEASMRERGQGVSVAVARFVHLNLL